MPGMWRAPRAQTAAAGPEYSENRCICSVELTSPAERELNERAQNENENENFVPMNENENERPRTRTRVNENES